MRLLASSGSFRSSVLAWVTFPVLPNLMTQSLRVLSLIPSSAAHTQKILLGYANPGLQ